MFTVCMVVHFFLCHSVHRARTVVLVSECLCVLTGARVQTSSVLLSLAELNDASNAVHAAQQKLEKIENELNAVKPVAAK